MIKRIAAALLCLLLTAAMGTSALALETNGSITINNASDGKSYSVYRLFDLESYNSETESYAYKTNAVWENFANGSGIKDVYLNIDSQGYVTWVNGAREADFAKLAKEYAKTNNIAPSASGTAAGGTVVITGLPLGYYLIDSPMGALCGLSTTKPDIAIEDKNPLPTVLKEVESAAGSTVYGTENHARIGSTISFRIAVTAQPGAENYVVHDAMGTGLTFKSISKITYRRADTPTPTELSPENYTVATSCADGCSFEISFKPEFLNGIVEETKINIYYTAELNQNALYAGEGPNENEAWLKYGDDNTTTHSKTKTYTYLFELVKTNSNKAVIQGAKFELYDSSGNKINLIKDEDTENTYRVATPEQSGAVGFTSAVIEAGDVYVVGLSAGSYSLREISPPAGYNRLENDFTFVMGNRDEEASWANDAQTIYKSGGINVVNQTGKMLPQTGGIGTDIFYGVGGLLLLVAGLLLIVKKRMY